MSGGCSFGHRIAGLTAGQGVRRSAAWFERGVGRASGGTTKMGNAAKLGMQTAWIARAWSEGGGGGRNPTANTTRNAETARRGGPGSTPSRGARTLAAGLLLVGAAVKLTHDIIVKCTTTSLMNNYDVILYSCLRQNYRVNDKGKVIYFYFDHGAQAEAYA